VSPVVLERLSLPSRYLLALLREPPRVAQLPDLDESQSEDLVRAAVAHGVAGIVHDALIRANGLSRVAPPALHRLAKLRFGTAAQYLLGSADLSVLARTLDTAGVPWAVMKGPSLAHLGYRDTTVRWSCDLDVLVSPDNFAVALDALMGAGAALLDLNWELQLRLMRSEASLRLPLGTLLDLHWHPVNSAEARSTTSFDVHAALSRRRLVPNEAGVPLIALCSIDNLTVVALHAALSGGHRLVWAKDIERLVTRDTPDWQDLARRATSAHVALLVGIMLRRAATLLGASVPPAAVDALLGGRAQAGVWCIGEHIATPRSLGGMMRTGSAFVLSLRGSPSQTARALATTARSYARGRLTPRRNASDKPGAVGSLSTNPLHHPAGGRQARDAYLAAITTESGTKLAHRARVNPRKVLDDRQISLSSR
jgi:hypothetical protein